MKKIIAMIATLLLCGATLAMAADTPTASKKAAVAKEAPEMGKLMAEPTEACHKMDMTGGGAMSPDLMKKMQEQMAKIRQTADPVERQKLMEAHFQSMQEAMQTMRGDMRMAGGMGGGMHCCCCRQSCGKNCKKEGNCARDQGKGAMPRSDAGSTPRGGTGSAADMMEQRMDMMQTMMENMLEHQRQMQPSK